uniref:Membrane-associated protein n=1 Tax=Macrostomum lignano TaxID=282301 RepID=A0A1I8FQX6_9PLAT
MCQCMNKFILVAVNIIFLLAGLVITGIAIWVHCLQGHNVRLGPIGHQDVDVDRATLDNYMNSTSMLLAALTLCWCSAAFQLLLASAAAAARSRRVLSAHVFTPSPSPSCMIAEIVGAILAAVFRNQIGDKLQPRLVTLEREHFLPAGPHANNKTTDAVNYRLVNYAQTRHQPDTDITGRTPVDPSHREFNGKLQTMPERVAGKQDWNNVADYLEDPACPNTGNGVVTEIICVVMACSLIQKNPQRSRNNCLKFRISSF